MPKIFISYRRDDAGGHAGRLSDGLTRRFGLRHVFMDVESIGVGRDYTAALRNAVRGCDVMLVVIGKDWLDCKDPGTGIRRLDNPDDWVRVETAEALRRDIPVVPVLVQGTPLPSPDSLPPDLRELVHREAIAIADTQWEADVSDLIRRLPHDARRRLRLGIVAAAALLAVVAGAYLFYTDGLGLRSPVDIPRSSIGWNFSEVGYYDMPPDANRPILLYAQPASWPHGANTHDLSIFPRLTYSMSGDFDVIARVRLTGAPTVSGGLRLAGVGLLSRKANQMLLLGRALGPTGVDVRSVLTQIDPTQSSDGYSGYLGDTKQCEGDQVELKIVKNAGLLGVFCRSGSGQPWTSVRQGSLFRREIGIDSSEVFLFAYSADSQDIRAAFDRFAVLQR